MTLDDLQKQPTLIGFDKKKDAVYFILFIEVLQFQRTGKLKEKDPTAIVQQGDITITAVPKGGGKAVPDPFKGRENDGLPTDTGKRPVLEGWVTDNKGNARAPDMHRIPFELDTNKYDSITVEIKFKLGVGDLDYGATQSPIDGKLGPQEKSTPGYYDWLTDIPKLPDNPGKPDLHFVTKPVEYTLTVTMKADGTYTYKNTEGGQGQGKWKKE
jgi:hypothetical protein